MEPDLIDEKIKQINQKILPISVAGALLVGTGILLFGPALKFSIMFAIPFSVITLCAIYEILFYFSGKEVMNEAKKRKRYLYRILDCSANEHSSSCFEEIKTSSSSENIHTDSRYHYLSCNIHNNHH